MSFTAQADFGAFCGEISNQDCTTHYSSLMKKLNLGTQMTVANRVFASNDIGVKKSYEEEVSLKLRATVQNLDFKESDKAAEIVNVFVRTETKGKIDKIVSPGNFKEATAFAINAIYFKGKWAKRFNKNQQQTFYVNEEVTKKTTFMYRAGNSMGFPYFNHLEFTALSLPYWDRNYRLTVILPKERYGLAELLPKLNGETLKAVITNEEMTPVNIAIPKFKIDTDLRITDALGRMGITEAFSLSADFSGMTDRPVQLGDAKHRAIMEIDEEGTTAAAYTALSFINITGISYEGKTRNFVADHPFLFVLSFLDNVLFLGQYYG